MVLSIHNAAVQAMSGTADALHVRTVGTQAMGSEVSALSAYVAGAQLMFEHFPILTNYSIGAQVMHRAEVDPLTGGLQNPAKYLIPTETVDMIYPEIIFPLCVSYGSTSVPRYETTKSEVLSGDETRQTRWAYPKHEYSVNMKSMNAQEIAEIMNIWHVCSGDLIGFLFLDPMDHTSLTSETVLSGSDITSTDQFVASAVGGQTDYPVYKYYSKGARTKQRRIRYPKADTMVVKVGDYETTQFEVSTADAVLRFTTPVAALALTVTKVGNVITRDDAGLWSDHFNVGDFVYFEGFTAPANDIIANAARVEAIDGSNMTIVQYDGTVWGGAGDEVSVAITFDSGLPATGQNISAGFWFYVPVRFDEGDSATSEIISGLRESAFADFGDIRLKEIFE